MGAVEDARYDGVDRRPCGKFDRATLRVYSLLFHLIDVGAVATVLWDRFLTPSQRKVISAGLNVSQEQARSLLSFLAAMHDIGKLIPSWQSFVPLVRIRLGEDLLADMGLVVHVPHARASMHAGLHLLGELGFAVSGNDSPAVRAAQSLGGHHGRFLQLDVDGAASAHRVQATLGGPVWQDLRRRYTRLLWYLFGVDEAPDRMSVEAAVLITGLTMVADRVASQRRYWVPNADTPSFGAAEHHSHARRQAEEEVERLCLTRFALDRVPFTTAHPGLEEPNALQASVMEELPRLVAERGSGIAVVTDAMGAGKSVTALEMARIFNEHCGTQGVMWLLPATAAADQAYEALDRYVRAHRPEYAPVTLVHHHSDLNEAYTGRNLSRRTCPFWTDHPTTRSPTARTTLRPATRRSPARAPPALTDGCAEGTTRSWPSTPSPPPTRHRWLSSPSATVRCACWPCRARQSWSTKPTRWTRSARSSCCACCTGWEL
ncbi:CRISPR-associated endonuclease Cas3'' [Streptomyces cyaneofuscatus]|uniref:CRISPR-associated endonuclease Cas3'' n=1 Tax=Streptomyces cyaneofuscatus TaxID=66883 RepID=UPI00345CFCF7